MASTNKEHSEPSCASVDAKDLVHLQPAASRRMLCCLQLE